MIGQDTNVLVRYIAQDDAKTRTVQLYGQVIDSVCPRLHQCSFGDGTIPSAGTTLDYGAAKHCGMRLIE